MDGKEAVHMGDIALFYFAAKGRVAHYGFVSEIGPGPRQFRSVEGNTSPESGVDREGDGVYVKTHVWGAVGSGGGFVRVGF